jgi:hypothetical protein
MCFTVLASRVTQGNRSGKRGRVAKGFVVDTGRARQIGDRLTSISQSIEGFQPMPQPRGPLGSGGLERAWSELERSVATAKQNLVRSIRDSAGRFTALADGAIQLDQQEAQEVETI